MLKISYLMQVNKKQRLGEEKVVDSFDIEDIGKGDKKKEKVAFCRCWKSSKVNPFEGKCFYHMARNIGGKNIWRVRNFLLRLGRF